MGSGAFIIYILLALVGILFNPIIWAIVIVTIILTQKNKKRQLTDAANANSGQATIATMRQANPMLKWNWLLYIGCFLIVLAMEYFINTINDSFVAPSTIIITLLVYAVGVAIYKTVDYLKPVARAFVYTGLCMIPLWAIALSSLQFPSNSIALVVNLTLMIAAFAGAYLVRDKIMAHIAFLTIIAFIWSFYPLIAVGYERGLLGYLFFMAPMAVGAVTMALHLTGESWLPDMYKSAAKNLGHILIPATFGTSLFLFLAGDIAVVAPFLRTLCAAFAVAHAAIYWLKTKSRIFMIMLRFAAQATIIAALADALNYSLGVSYSEATASKALCLLIVWMLTFMAQAIFSLFCKRERPEDDKMERIVNVVSILCILATPIFCTGYPATIFSTVCLVICAIVAVLGVVHAIHYRNVSWSIATAGSIMALPLIFGIYIATPKWDGYAYFPCYLIISILFLLGTYALGRIQKKEAQDVGMISLILSCYAMTIAAGDMQLAYVGYLITSAIAVGFAYITSAKAFYEVAIYTGAIGLISLTNSVVGGPFSSFGSDSSQQMISLRWVLYAHIIGAALIGAHVLAKFLYDKGGKARFVIGYSLFTMIMALACISYYSEATIIWALLFLIEQAAALIYSVAKKENWLIWFSSISILFTAFRLTSGMYFLWLGIIGIGLIAVVVWQLRKAAEQNALNGPNGQGDVSDKPKTQ